MVRRRSFQKRIYKDHLYVISYLYNDSDFKEKMSRKKYQIPNLIVYNISFRLLMDDNIQTIIIDKMYVSALNLFH